MQNRAPICWKLGSAHNNMIDLADPVGGGLSKNYAA